MKKEYRIKKQEEIDYIFKNSKKIKSSNFMIVFKKNQNESHFRFSISIGTKFGNAVERNKIKRQLREIINEYKQCLKNYLFIIVVKPQEKKQDFVKIKEEIKKVLIMSKIMEEK